MKILLLESILVNIGDDRGGVPHKKGTIVDVPQDKARTLVQYNRAKYTDKKDDTNKAGTNTAPPEVVKEAEARAKAEAKAQAEAKAA